MKAVTLRNLYRILTVSDYPIPSLAVINKRSKSGLTQTTFWAETCLPEFQQGQIGKMVWRSTGNRNRYFSNLCNRVLPESIYNQYTQEILNVLKPRLITAQTRKFFTVLQSHNYRPAVLKSRLEYLICHLSEDENCNESVSNFFSNLLEQINSTAAESKQQAFLLSSTLTWLFVFAITGSGFSQLLEPVSKKPELFVLNMQIQSKQSNTPSTRPKFSVEYLGSLRQLTGQGLPAKQYYGHDSEILDITESVLSGEKIAISGIGGLGKTEITRQVLQYCIQKKSLNKLCLVEYNNSLRISFRSAFLTYGQQIDEDEERIYTLGHLRTNLDKNSLLVIDNMDTLAEDDIQWLEKIQQESYSVIITTRMNAIDGFKTFRLSETKPADCLLIYRNTIGTIMSQDDKKRFMELMERPLFCHPMTVLLICKAVRQQKFTFEQIATELQKDNTDLAITTDNRNECLASMYRHLYNMCHLSNAEKDLADLFALLPLGEYGTEWLENHAPTGKKSTETAQKLADMGYLTDTGNGYAMHTLIKQCLKKKTISSKHLNALLAPFINYYLSVCDLVLVHNSYDIKYVDCFYKDTVIFTDLLFLLLQYSNDLEFVNSLFFRTQFAWGIIQLFPTSVKLKLRPLLKETISKIITDPFLIDVFMLTYDFAIYGFTDQEILKDYYDLLLEQKYDLSMPIIQEFLNVSLTVYPIQKLPKKFINAALSCVKSNTDILILKDSLCKSYIKSGDYTAAAEYIKDLSSSFPNQYCVPSLFGVTCTLCSFYSITRETEKLLHIIEIIESILESYKFPPIEYYRMQFLVLHFKGIAYLHNEQYEKALPCFLEQQDFYKEMEINYSGAQNGILCTIALAYAKIKKYAEAEWYYKEALNLDNSQMNITYKSMTLNNYSVLLLDMNKPLAAIEKLKQCLEFVYDSTTALAEPYRNLARAYDMLGDEENAQQYWQKAYPLLVDLYGESHERTIDAYQHIHQN